MNENDDDKKALDIYLKMGYTKDDFGKAFHDVFAKSPWGNSSGIKIDREKGIIEVDKRIHFPERGTERWHEINITTRRFGALHEIGFMEPRLMYVKGVGIQEIMMCLNYANTELIELQESMKYFKDKGVDTKNAIQVELLLMYFIVRVERKYKYRILLFNFLNFFKKK